MPFPTSACARCATGNHLSERFCTACALPLGAATPDAEAALDALGPFEAPEPTEVDAATILREFVARSGLEAVPARQGWRLHVDLRLDRHQAVYVGRAEGDHRGRTLLSLVSVCGPATDRDARGLLKLNALAVEGHYAIKTLRGEEYFVVIQNFDAEDANRLDAGALIRRIAEAADTLEDRLSRGRDLY